jgi:hypothetical protein
MSKIKVVVLCTVCGFKIRGKKHNDGDHHQKGKYGSYSPPFPTKRK